MYTIQTNKLRHNNQGFASIVIALVLILVLSLLTVGFAQLARREQQDALNKQLATQATYAAESGINDAVQALPAIRAADAVTPIDPNTCLSSTLLPNTKLDPTNGTSTGVGYTCVLVNLRPTTLFYKSVSPDSDRYNTFATTGNLSSLTVYWHSDDPNGRIVRPTGGLTPVTSWHSPSVLQFSITPLDQTDRASLIARTFTVYLYPASGGGTVNYDTNNQGQIINGACSNAGALPCSVTLKNLPGGAGIHYLVHVISYYDISDITVGNLRDPANAQLNFNDGQIQVDSTGKAKNDLKRLQVRPKDSEPLPSYPVEAQNICKEFSIDSITTKFEDTDPSCVLTP